MLWDLGSHLLQLSIETFAFACLWSDNKNFDSHRVQAHATVFFFFFIQNRMIQAK